MRLPLAEEIQITSVLEIFLDAYGNKDINTMMRCFSDDPDTVVIGPGEQEKIMGTSNIHNSFARDMQGADDLKFKLTWQVVAGSGPVSWVASECFVDITVQGITTSVKARWTVVLENRGGYWLIRHSHFSLPAGEGEEEEQQQQY